jgi:hypothetical protein
MKQDNEYWMKSSYCVGFTWPANLKYLNCNTRSTSADLGLTCDNIIRLVGAPRNDRKSPGATCWKVEREFVGLFHVGGLPMGYRPKCPQSLSFPRIRGDFAFRVFTQTGTKWFWFSFTQNFSSFLTGERVRKEREFRDESLLNIFELHFKGCQCGKFK